MKDNKTKRGIFTFIIAILLILSSFVSLGTSTEIVNDATQKTNIRLCVNSFQATSSVTIKGGTTQPSGTPSFGDYENIIVADDVGDESYPSMVVSEFDALVAYEYKEDSNPYLYLKKSNNYGQSWFGQTKLTINFDNSEISVNSPALCTRPKKKNAYGVFTSSIKNSGIIGFLDIPDISGNFDNIEIDIVDWSVSDFWNFSNPDIVYHNVIKDPWITCSIGSTTYSDGPCNDSLMFCYSNYSNPEYNRWINWNPEIENCSNVSIAMDEDSKELYGICEINNGTNQDLLFFNGFYDFDEHNDPYINLEYTTFASDDSLAHPQIFVKNNKVYVVAESDTQGIILLYKSGLSWKEDVIDVTTTPSPKYPLIYVNDTRILCTFIENGNISLTTSPVGLFNWGPPVQLNSQNNSVVEEYRFADLLDDDYVVWVDNRSGNNDIYSVILGLPEMNLTVIPESVEITTEGYWFIPTNNWINFTIKNSGEAAVENVKVRITYHRIKGTNITEIETEYPASILYLAAGAKMPFTRPLFRLNFIEFVSALINFAGIQSITVTVDPDGKYYDVYPEDNTFTLETNVSYANIFPLLEGFEGFFINF